MEKNILIIGGYGSVGSVITRHLSEIYPGRVIVAGRNYNKAEQLSKELNHRAVPLRCDIADTGKYSELLKDVALVIMCIDQENTDFVEHCFLEEINYIDITAGYEFLSEVEKLNGIAVENNAIGVLSVGLAPGITNLLAKHCKNQLEEAMQLDIHVLLGSGEKHGTAAYQWMLNNLNTEYSVKGIGEAHVVKSFSEPKKVYFNSEIGKRKTFLFNLSDQHVLADNMDGVQVFTRVCFDSLIMTNLIAFAEMTGLSAILKKELIQDIVIKLINSISLGSDIFMAKVIGRGYDGSTYKCSLSGHGEGYVTGLVAAEVAKRLISSSHPTGVYHLEQLFEPQEAIIALLETEESLKAIL
ncbi:saccharopine dehydrogenase family protein [Fodinibius salsisoli]|uniref:Saccharopine dehydrogenase NADP-binding domain-containing protein n=1 Tax=Fodinibius salsisoli TaxID=2820877 RepID=A0ABT3PIG2_9BACT|nr:saccharopine dehydrogenase NADP-binding domain-containing protein [Fodinibius salsisoli]MCW9705726.1 saccharopine dehydrogenase NADP-binding domain-containing protein [Fodinibius salsisoli]